MVPSENHNWRVVTFFWLICVAAVFCALLYQFRMWYLDDAFISMRYARNLVEGSGLVFNSGERVEGYTNFAWVMLLAAGFTVRLNVPLLARAASIFFAVVTLCGLFVYLRAKYRGHPILACVTVLLLAANGDYAAWSNSAMETMMFTCFLFLGVVVFSPASYRRLFTCGFLLTLAVFTRPEGSISIALLSVFLFVYCCKEKAVFRKYVFKIGAFVLPVVLLYLPYFLMRYNYYGYLFPNTFYAKVGNSFSQILRGAGYTANFAFDYAFLLLPACAGYVFNFKRTMHIFIFMLVFMGYVVYVGGDPFPAYRFIMPLSPFIALGYFLCIKQLALKMQKTRMTWLIIVCILVSGCVQLAQVWYRHDFLRLYTDDVTPMGKRIGAWMRSHLPADTVIALNAVGAMPYYSRLKTVDMLGLTDEYLAHRGTKLGAGLPGHEVGDGAYVLSRQPDIIIFSGPWGHEHPLFKSDFDLYFNPVFSEQYVFYVIPIHDIIFQCYVRKDNLHLIALLDDYLLNR